MGQSEEDPSGTNAKGLKRPAENTSLLLGNEADPLAVLLAAKRRLLEESANAASSREVSTEKVGAEAKEASDSEVSDFSIVQFLKTETESALGFALADNPRESGVAVMAEPIYETRDPRVSSAAEVEEKKKKKKKKKKTPTAESVMLSQLPVGSRIADPGTNGQFAWAGQSGGVVFSKKPQIAMQMLAESQREGSQGERESDEESSATGDEAAPKPAAIGQGGVRPANSVAKAQAKANSAKLALQQLAGPGWKGSAAWAQVKGWQIQ